MHKDNASARAWIPGTDEGPAPIAGYRVSFVTKERVDADSEDFIVVQEEGGDRQVALAEHHPSYVGFSRDGTRLYGQIMVSGKKVCRMYTLHDFAEHLDARPERAEDVILLSAWMEGSTEPLVEIPGFDVDHPRYLNNAQRQAISKQLLRVLEDVSLDEPDLLR